jgi:hypothetical protein
MLGGANNFDKRSKNPSSKPMSRTEVYDAFNDLKPSPEEKNEFKTLVAGVKKLNEEYFKNLSSVFDNHQTKVNYKDAVVNMVNQHEFTVENPNNVKYHVLSYAAFCDTLTYAKLGFYRNGGAVQTDLLAEAKKYAPSSAKAPQAVEMESHPLQQ